VPHHRRREARPRPGFRVRAVSRTDPGGVDYLVGRRLGPRLRRYRAPQARRPGANRHDSWPATQRAPGDQPAADALRLPHWADRPAGASARRRQLEIAQYPEAALAELTHLLVASPANLHAEVGVPARSGFEDPSEGPIDGQRADILPVPQIVHR